MPSSGILAGDAVFEFLGDDTNLQGAFARVNAGAKTAVRPAANEVFNLQERIKALETELTALQIKFDRIDGVTPMRKTSAAAREAKAEVGLLGEAIGVRLPRHVRGFVTELPGVGAALSAAFEATAILFVIQAIIEVTKKITDWIIETYLLTAALKKSDELIKESNVTLLASAGNVKKLKDEYALLGLTGVAKTSQQIKQLNVDLNANADALHKAQKELGGLTDSPRSFQEQHANEINETQTRITLLAAKAKEFEGQKATLEKQGAIERRTAKFANDTLALTDEKAFRTSIVELLLQESRLVLANQGKLDTQGSALQAAANERLYQDQLDFLTRKRALLNEDANATLQQKKSADAAIENAAREHTAKMLKENADLIQGIRNLTLRDLPEPFEFAADDIENATLRMAHSLEKLEHAAMKSFRNQGDYLKIYATSLAATGNKLKAYEAIAVDVYNQVLGAEAGAIQQAILGQKSWGAALAETTKSELASIAARSTVWALYWLGRAIGDSFWNPEAAGLEFLAAEQLGAIALITAGLSYAVPGGGGKENGPGDTGIGPIATSPTSGAGVPQQGPTTVVTRLGGGGLITQRTLAMLGDSKSGSGHAEEVVVPLAEDDKTLSRIAERISDHMGGTGRPIINVYPQGHLIDMNQLVTHISQGVKDGKYRMTSSTALDTKKRG